MSPLQQIWFLFIFGPSDNKMAQATKLAKLLSKSCHLACEDPFPVIEEKIGEGTRIFIITDFPNNQAEAEQTQQMIEKLQGKDCKIDCLALELQMGDDTDPSYQEAMRGMRAALVKTMPLAAIEGREDESTVFGLILDAMDRKGFSGALSMAT